MADKFKYYRPAKFSIDLEVGPEIGDDATGTVSLNDRPFIVQGIRHQIIDDGGAPLTMPLQDGLYRIDWSIGERTRFATGAKPMADSAFGSIRHGIWEPLESPVELIGTAKMEVRVINAWGPRISEFKVQVIFVGVEKVGSVAPFMIEQGEEMDTKQ